MKKKNVLKIFYIRQNVLIFLIGHCSVLCFSSSVTFIRSCLCIFETLGCLSFFISKNINVWWPVNWVYRLFLNFSEIVFIFFLCLYCRFLPFLNFVQDRFSNPMTRNNCFTNLIFLRSTSFGLF